MGVFGALITGSVAEGPRRCPTRLRCTPGSAPPSVPPREPPHTPTHTHPHPSLPFTPFHSHTLHPNTPYHLCFITSERVSLIKSTKNTFVTLHVLRTPIFKSTARFIRESSDFLPTLTFLSSLQFLRDFAMGINFQKKISICCNLPQAGGRSQLLTSLWPYATWNPSQAKYKKLSIKPKPWWRSPY